MLNFVPEIIAAVLELALAGLQAFPAVLASYFSGPLHAISTLTGLQLAILAIYVVLRLSMESHNSRRNWQTVTFDLNTLLDKTSQIRTLGESEFYSNFAFAIQNAKKAVVMCQLDTIPPKIVPGTPMAQYYGGLEASVSANSRVSFQRVERISPEKFPWIAALVDTYRDVPNFSLSCLNIDLEPRQPPYVSVQLVDDHTAYLVAVAKHHDVIEPRDILIRDPSVNRLWRAYFDERLWEHATPLIEDGALNESNWATLRAQMGDC